MKIKKWLNRIGLSFLVIIIMSLILGVIYEQISRYNIQNYLENKSGEFVNIDGHQLYYLKRGEGGPTVVFESGLPGDHRVWQSIQEKVSHYTTTVSYDRAGILFSERGKESKTPEAISNDLYKLLEAGGFKKPYILVGHSYAGITLRPFIEKSREFIKGIIFVDPSHPEQLQRASKELFTVLDPSIPPRWLMKLMNATGIIRLTSQDPMLYLGIKNEGVLDEAYQAIEDFNKSAKSFSFGDIPLVVISASSEKISDNFKSKKIGKEFMDLWIELHKEILHLSSNSRRVLATKSTHYVMDYEPELIIGEIIQMIESIEVD